MPRGVYVRKPITEEARRNISEARMGIVFTKEHKEALRLAAIKKLLSPKAREMAGRPWRGKKLSIEHRRKMSIAHKGEKSTLWKGGISLINRSIHKRIRETLKYRLWRETVFDRDNYTCQECGGTGIYIEAHHILSFTDFSHRRFDIANGLTLCKKCHRRITFGSSEEQANKSETS